MGYSQPWGKKPFVKPHQAGSIKGLAQGGTKVKVSNLHYEITEDKLSQIFGKFGGVHSCQILWDRHDRSTGEAFVLFENPKSAESAVSNLNNTEIEG